MLHVAVHEAETCCESSPSPYHLSSANVTEHHHVDHPHHVDRLDYLSDPSCLGEAPRQGFRFSFVHFGEEGDLMDVRPYHSLCAAGDDVSWRRRCRFVVD